MSEKSCTTHTQPARVKLIWHMTSGNERLDHARSVVFVCSIQCLGISMSGEGQHHVHILAMEVSVLKMSFFYTSTNSRSMFIHVQGCLCAGCIASCYSLIWWPDWKRLALIGWRDVEPRWLVTLILVVQHASNDGNAAFSAKDPRYYAQSSTQYMHLSR
jgi:hypothetical protein